MSGTIALEAKYAIRAQLQNGLEDKLQRALNYQEQLDLTGFVKKFDDLTWLNLFYYWMKSNQLVQTLFHQVHDLASTITNPKTTEIENELFEYVPLPSPEVNQIITLYQQAYSIKIPWDELSQQQRDSLDAIAEEYSDQLEATMEFQNEFNKLIAWASLAVAGDYIN